MEMPEGTYFVGDPCYAIPNDEWDDFLNQYMFNEGLDGRGTVGSFKGKCVFAAYTAYGDGTYEGSDGEMYSVDSGSIGLIPIELATKYPKSELERLGSIKIFEKPFDAFAMSGVFFFEDLRIDTAGDEDEDFEDF